jgi:hypothetical protein
LSSQVSQASQLKTRSPAAILDAASTPYRVVTSSRVTERQCTSPVAVSVQRSIRANSPSVRGR